MNRFFSECLLHLGVLPYSFCVVLCVCLSFCQGTLKLVYNILSLNIALIYIIFSYFLTMKIHLFVFVLAKTTASAPTVVAAIFYVESDYLTHTYNAFRPNRSTSICMHCEIYTLYMFTNQSE